MFQNGKYHKLWLAFQENVKNAYLTEDAMFLKTFLRKPIPCDQTPSGAPKS